MTEPVPGSSAKLIDVKSSDAKDAKDQKDLKQPEAKKPKPEDDEDASIFDCLPCCRPPDPNRKLPDRVVQINGDGAKEYISTDPLVPIVTYPTNVVITSRYTWWDFIPRNLFEQFLNLANVYFLIIGALQIIPSISTTGGNPTQYQPLAFIVFVSAVRAAKEDWGKHQADKARNGYEYQVLRGGGAKWTMVQSGELQVGDIVKLRNNEMVPADMLVVGSAHTQQSQCYIDKKNLNGEPRLETVWSVMACKQWATDDQGITQLKVRLTYEPPNKFFDTFRGRILVQNNNTEANVNASNFLLRETNLRNTPWVYGIVLYTGDDTRIQMSNKSGAKLKLKKSVIMRRVDGYLVGMLSFQAILCVIGGIIAGVWHQRYADDMWFLGFQYKHEGAPATGILAFFTWFIILSQMVPISLIVSAEMVKFIQSLFIEWDATIYYSRIDKATKCNSSTIHEDLGLVDYIFSDKTGTLTQNNMTFRYVLMGDGVEYGSKETEISKAVKVRQAEVQARLRAGPSYKPTPPTPWSVLRTPITEPGYPSPDNCCDKKCGWFMKNFWNPEPEIVEENNKGLKVGTCLTQEEKDEIMRALWMHPAEGDNSEAQAARARLRRFMTHMAMSGTIRPFIKDGKQEYESDSAEELAMVQFAAQLGFFLKQRNPTILEVHEWDGQMKNKTVVTEQYNHVATFGFTSERARVTVIYQNQRTNEVSVMIKGQDKTVLPLVNNKPDEVKLLQALTIMCNNGLRTLVCGFGDLPADWWAKREVEYTRVKNLDVSPASKLHNENPRGCPGEKGGCEKCAQFNLYQQIEKDARLQYLCSIGLEDELQALVPECIQDCLRAGIKVWMITGDKLETARNIGMACNLIDADMAPQIQEGADVGACIKAFNEARLLEITGQWASLVKNKEELGKLFDAFDTDNNGRIEKGELAFGLKALKFSLNEQKLQDLFRSAGGSETHSLDKQQFIQLMQSCQLTMYEAVLSDVEEAITRVSQIQDHDASPVSVLVNRDAFMVMNEGRTEKEPLSNAPPKEALLKLQEKFFRIASVAKSLVFAQALPTMKRQMVTEIQQRVPGAVTLAIGDGANDVDMIRAAHVGVGISGVEGTAATNNSDYAIGTFRYVHQLLFVHGFWSYQRIANLVNFIFYKASLVAMTMYFFGFFSGFSGTQFFNDAPYQLYNVMYTALPIIAVAVSDRALPMKMLENTPEHLNQVRGKLFTGTLFFKWVVRSVLHALCLFMVPVLSLETEGHNVADPNGKTHGLWFTSTICYYAVVLTPTFMIGFQMQSFTALHAIAVSLSIAALYLVTWIIGQLRSIDPDLYGVVDEIYGNASAWFTLILAVALPLLIELCLRYVQRQWAPSYTQVLQEHDFIVKEQQKQYMALKESGSASAPVPSSPKPSSPLRKDERKHEALKHISALAQEQKDRDEKKQDEHRDRMQAAVIKSMLRFRNLTGSQFDSVANARLQTHDRLAGGGEQKQEQKR